MTEYRATWDTYAAAWKSVTSADKAIALRASVDPTATYRDPTGEAAGQEALVATMLAFHQQVPGGHFVTTYFQAHHDRSIAKWTMHDGAGVQIGEGISYAEYGTDGRLVEMTGFWG